MSTENLLWQMTQIKQQFFLSMLTNTTAIANKSKLVNLLTNGKGKAFPQVMKTWTGDGILWLASLLWHMAQLEEHSWIFTNSCTHEQIYFVNYCIPEIERAPSYVKNSGREKVLSALKNSGKNIVTAWILTALLSCHIKNMATHCRFLNINNTVTYG